MREKMPKTINQETKSAPQLALQSLGRVDAFAIAVREAVDHINMHSKRLTRDDLRLRVIGFEGVIGMEMIVSPKAKYDTIEEEASEILGRYGLKVVDSRCGHDGATEFIIAEAEAPKTEAKPSKPASATHLVRGGTLEHSSLGPRAAV